MIKLLRATSSNEDFIGLVELLDDYLRVLDGSDHEYYNQFNKIKLLDHVVVAYKDGQSVGCGAIKHFEPGTMEVKRMYVDPKFRGLGIGRKILEELERWTIEMSCKKTILETGKRQFEAIALYKNCGYSLIPNYGQYKQMENSVCFEKHL